MNRFYQKVSSQKEGAGFVILLDDKPVKTPLRNQLLAPTAALADMLISEWESQSEKILPDTMPLTQLVNTSIDRIGPDREAIVDQILNYAGSDLVCYYAEEPEALVQRQKSCWAPLTEWLEREKNIKLVVTAGIQHVTQPETCMTAWQGYLQTLDDCALTSFQALVGATGSVVISCAILEGQLNESDAFTAVFVDELFQAEKWGMDTEVKSRQQSVMCDIEAAKKLYNLTRI